MTQHTTAAAASIFDSSLTFLAINILEEELEEADCFGNVQYSEIQADLSVKRRVLKHESLRADWFKVLRSGEVLITLFHMSDKVRSVLDKHNCPLQPVLEGSEHSSWQRLRSLFRCNWQNFYSVIEYLQQYRSVRVAGLDVSGKVIVDCADIETARIIVMGALTQCFVLLGKQPPASISGDYQLLQEAAAPAANSTHQSHSQPQQQQHQTQQQQTQQQPPQQQPPQQQPPQQQTQAQNQSQQQQQQPAEYSNNNAGNAAKTSALQPKVSRLSNKKRVICIYDTTTSEGSDQASIEATPIDNRNSATPDTDPPDLQPTLHQAHQHHQPQQNQSQEVHKHQQPAEQKQLQDEQAKPAVNQVPDIEPLASRIFTDDGILDQVLNRLDEIKALLLNAGGSSCQLCRQRILGSLSGVSEVAGRGIFQAVSVAAQATSNASAANEPASDSASASASGSASPPARQQLQNGHSSAASVVPPVAAVAPAAAASDVESLVKLSGRKRGGLRRVTSKRSAVIATKLVGVRQEAANASIRDATIVPHAPDVTAGALHRSKTRDSARSTDDDIRSNPAAASAAGAPTNKKGSRVRTKVIIKRRAKPTKHQSLSNEPQLVQQQHEESKAPDLPLTNVDPVNEPRAPSESDSRRRRAASGDHRKKQVTLHQQPQQQQPLQQLASAVSDTQHQARQSPKPVDLAAARPQKVGRRGGGAVASGANGNNDGGVKKITTSTVQDLISRLQAVLNQEV